MPDAFIAPIAALLTCAGCAHRAQVAAALPSASLSLSASPTSADGRSPMAIFPHELRLSLYVTFRLRPLALPAAADVDPELAALPCDEDDATCQAEARGFRAEVLGRWLDQP